MKLQKITPCLWFDHEAEDAARFYCSLFPGSRILHVAPMPEGGPGPAGAPLMVTFELQGLQIMALNGGPHFTLDEAFSLHVACEDQREVDDLWDRLTAEGGEESMCGWLKDKYGLSWQIVPTRLHELLQDPDPRRARATMQAMLQMRRIQVDALERAAADAGK